MQENASPIFESVILGNMQGTDKCINSLETRKEAAKFISETKELMSTAKFDLQGWVTCEKIVEKTQKRYIPKLGLSWDTENDKLSCNSAIKISEENITKRTLFSVAQRIYDPIGFTSPTTLIPKIILQKTWKRKIDWDDVLPPDIYDSDDVLKDRTKLILGDEDENFKCPVLLPEQWTAYYRFDAKINTDMSVERCHRDLKYNSDLQGKWEDD
ncbi:hypothetical protein HNY73_010575 [Argiope bruennichi]|uniref:Uncharacterized protein n=1 Tax=Argiope bruennichi TaxID=94029 RepID=A0A8T0F3E8_ARGBR|nr:hypothetical protein HNY73_010575 [Argiope bruennichi]